MEKDFFLKFNITRLRKLKTTYFSDCVIDEKQVMSECKKYINYYKEKLDILENANGLYVIIIYVISRNVIKNNMFSCDLISKLTNAKNHTITNCTNYISPYSLISFPIEIHGNFNYIGAGYNIGGNFVCGNNCRLYDNNIIVFDNKVKIGENVKLEDDVKVYCGIGDNCTIGTGCNIRENIASDVTVECKNNVQIKSGLNKMLGEEKTPICYGVVPKFKNMLAIYGENFYKPKVKIVVPFGKVDYDICFWDKNKILVRLEKVLIDSNCCKNTLVVFSNGLRITLVNDIGVEKALKLWKK